MTGHPPELARLVAELRVLRERGLLRQRHHPFPVLEEAARQAGASVDQLLEQVVARMDGQLGEATAYTLGLVPGTKDWAAQDRRKRAAALYGVTPERFRRQQELLILENLAHEILGRPPEAAECDELPMGGSLRVVTKAGAVTLHRQPVETLRGVEVIVSSENIYLEMSKWYKSSMSARLRSAAAVRNELGDVVDDVLQRELREWLAARGRAGGTVMAGTVVPTSAGELERHGVRRICHAAVVVPRAGGDTYDVERAAVARTVAWVFDHLEREGFRSVCLPLFGSGRGGLDPAVAFSCLWEALAPELAREVEVHLVVRSARGTSAALDGLRAEGSVQE